MTRTAPHPGLVALAVVGSLALTGCGPTKKLDISVRQAGVDIVYGDQIKPLTPKRAADANPLPTGFPAIFVPPVRQLLLPTHESDSHPTTLPTPVVPPLPVCPTASPLDVPAVSASSDVVGTPAPGVYTFSRKGDVQLGTVKHHVDDAHFTRTVSPARVDPSSTPARKIFAFDQTESQIGAHTLTTFRVDPGSRTVPDGGLSVARQTTTQGKDVNDFVPQPALRILTLPAVTEASNYAPNRETGVDPVNGTYETLSHLTGLRTRVDVCGTVVDTWAVTVSADVVTGTSSFHVDAVYDIATQLGGLIVQEKVVVSGTQTDLQTFKATLVTTLRSLKPATP